MAVDILSSIALDLIITNRPPSETELGSARQMLLHLQHDISDISAQMVEEEERLRKRLRKLESSRRTLQRKEARLKCVVAPIRRVPQDVICLIFDYCLREYCALEDDLGDFLPSSVDDRPASDHSLPLLSARQLPLRLTHVSRAFRTIVLAMPTLWSIAEFKIQLPNLQDRDTSDYYKNAGNSRRNQISGMEEWLRRSGSLPLNLDVYLDLEMFLDPDLYFNCSPPNYNHQDEEILTLCNDMINIIISCHSRWRDIRFSFDYDPPEQLISALSSLNPEDLPLLRTLRIYSYGYKQSTRYVKCMPIFSCSSLTTLTGVALDGLHIYKDTLSNLTLLDAYIRSYNLTSVTTLRKCTSLIELRLVNRAYTRDIAVPEDVIELPYLQKLYLIDNTWTLAQDAQYSITTINYMITPKLHTFYYNTSEWPLVSIPPDIFTRPHSITTLGLSGSLSCALFIEILRYCPQIKRLDGLPRFSYSGQDLAVACDKLLIRLVDADDAGDIICPKLEDMNGGYDPIRIANVNTLHSIITLKGMDPSANLAPWRKLRAKITCRRKDEPKVQKLLEKCNGSIFCLIFSGLFDDDDESR